MTDFLMGAAVGWALLHVLVMADDWDGLLSRWGWV